MLDKELPLSVAIRIPKDNKAWGGWRKLYNNLLLKVYVL